METGTTMRKTQHTCTTLANIISTIPGSVASTAAGERAAAVIRITWPTYYGTNSISSAIFHHFSWEIIGATAVSDEFDHRLLSRRSRIGHSSNHKHHHHHHPSQPSSLRTNSISSAIFHHFSWEIIGATA